MTSLSSCTSTSPEAFIPAKEKSFAPRKGAFRRGLHRALPKQHPPANQSRQLESRVAQIASGSPTRRVSDASTAPAAISSARFGL